MTPKRCEEQAPVAKNVTSTLDRKTKSFRQQLAEQELRLREIRSIAQAHQLYARFERLG